MRAQRITTLGAATLAVVLFSVPLYAASVVRSVTVSADDAQQVGTTVTIDGTTIGASLDATTKWAGMRFLNITIPAGSTINTATLEVVPSAATEDEPLVTIFFEDADSCATFTTGASNISNRSMTSSVAWSSTNMGADGATYFSAPDLAAILQTVVNRAGWASGNAVCVIIQGGATANRDLTIEAQDLGPDTNPPKLTIDYTAPTFPTTSVLENCNRVENPLSTGWAGPVFPGDGQLQANGTQCLIGSDGFASSYRSAGTFGPDSEVYFTIPTLGAGTIAFWLRVATPNTAGVDGYYVQLSGVGGTNSLQVSRVDNGSFTTIGAAQTPGNLSAGDSFGVSIIGSTIQAWRKTAGTWSAYGSSRSDSTYTGAGFIGIEMTSSATRLDDISGGTVSVVAGAMWSRALLLGVGQ